MSDATGLVNFLPIEARRSTTRQLYSQEQLVRELRPLAAYAEVEDVRVLGAIGVVELKTAPAEPQKLQAMGGYDSRVTVDQVCFLIIVLRCLKSIILGLK